MKSQELDNYNKIRFEGKSSEDPIMDWMFDATDVNIPSSDTDIAWNKIQAKMAPVGKSTSSNSSNVYLKVAAGLSLLAVFTYLFISFFNQPNILQITTAEMAVDVNFPDGSFSKLAPNGMITYPVEFGETRSVTLEGEAYFDIMESDVPFIISVNDINVRVLGTAFNVNTRGDEVRVAVERGLVAIEKNDQQVKIAKGQEGIFNRRTYEIVIDTTPNPNAHSWRTGRFVFNQTPLEDALNDLEKYYGVSFKISGQLKECRITANFDNASLEDVLKVLETILSVTITREKSEVRLKGKGC